jgi:Host cell surface-exposed lipoprotein
MTDQQHPGNLPPQQPGGLYQQGPPPGYGQQPPWPQPGGPYQQGPPPGYGAPPSYGPPQPPQRKRHRVRYTILGIAGAIVLIIIIASVGTAGKNNAAAGTSAGSDSSQAPSAAATTPSVAVTTPSPAAPAAPQYTPEQQQAIEAAEGYLQMGSGFSRLGLIQQLDSSAGNGFPESVAKFAVNHIKVNWDQQAIEAAEGYLQMGSGFSRLGLIQQLDSSAGNSFPESVAKFAVNHIKVNWDHQAAEAAKGYMQEGGFSYDSMVQQLDSPYGNDFTYSQAAYGAKAVGL